MKLSALNVALSNLKGNPYAKIRLGAEDETGLVLTIEKTKLKINLKEKFGERSAETGLILTDDGELKLDKSI